MAKIGIYGGTFDPIHNGHIYIAKQAKEQLALDEIWWVVSGNPPHKEDAITGRILRYQMCHIALEHEQDMLLKDFEMYRTRQCYSYELLTSLHQLFPEHKWYFIMGEDSLIQFSTWRHPEIIAKLAALVIAIRTMDTSATTIEDTARRIQNRYHANVFLLDTKNVPVSSTQLRQMVYEGKCISELVPQSIEDYIIQHHLYQKTPQNGIPLAVIQDELQKKLKPGRYRHTIGVMETAANLAMRYGMPIEKLRLAGLLHDCAKCYSNQELIDFCNRYHLSISAAEERSPHLLHAKVGAYLAEKQYLITDSSILQAILHHTTGAPAMSLAEQIVFVADYIEPNRNRAKRLAEIRQLAYFDLDLTTAMILEDTIEFLKQKKQPMDEKTLETYDYFCKKILSREVKQQRMMQQ